MTFYMFEGWMVGPISLTFAHLPFFVAFFTFVICHGKSTLHFVLNLKLAICRVGWSTPIFCRFSNQQQKALSVLLLHPACSLSTLTISTGKYLLSIFYKHSRCQFSWVIFMKILIVIALAILIRWSWVGADNLLRRRSANSFTKFSFI